MSLKTYGSLCSGIEAASFVLEPRGLQPLWFSEIADFQSRFLSLKYPSIPNLGDMNNLPEMIESGQVSTPDMICGGTPCQAFSLAGWRNGINDDRGQLTLKYIDIINANDKVRLRNGQNRTVFLWENVEGALTDKTNAFGCFLAGLLDLDTPLIAPTGKSSSRNNTTPSDTSAFSKWPTAGVVYGKDRNIAWRVLDAKYFGVPQQRRRVYVIGGGKDFHPEKILFEIGNIIQDPYKSVLKKVEPNLFDNIVDDEPIKFELIKKVKGHTLEAFRSYSDCLYAAYGTKWNGNAAAFNGSLFFAQNGRLRRLSPLECERLMGFPDNYTLIDKCTDTQRYQAVGNSWAIPVIQWLAERLLNHENNNIPSTTPTINEEGVEAYLLDDFVQIENDTYINASKIPYNYKLANMVDIADINCPEKQYITDKGCLGILRRKYEHNAGMNPRLERVLKDCVSKESLRELSIDY